MCTLTSFLAEAVARYGSRPALVMNGRTLTYDEIDTSANRVANSLIRHGVKVGDRVALWLPKSPEAIVSIWGILKSGAAYVPVDPWAPASRCASIARDCQIAALVTAPEFAEDLPGAFDGPAAMKMVLYAGDPSKNTSAPWRSVAWSEVEAESDMAPIVHIDDGDLAVVQYTSGSSATPKGVMLSHRALAGQAEWTVACSDLSNLDRIAGYTPLSSAMSTFDVFAGVRAGATIFPVSAQMAPFAAAVAASWSQQRITCFYVVSSVLSMLLSRGNLETLDFSALRMIVIGGEHLPVERLREAMQLLPQVRFVISYGRTEAKVRSWHEVKFPPVEIDTRTIGKTSAEMRLFVLDEARNPVGDGEIGELWISGPGLMLGYNRLPEVTAEVIQTVNLSCAESVRACRTGDLVRRRANGELELIGRSDQQIKIRGYRVDTGEIEAVLCRHQAVQAAAVVPILDTQHGDLLKAFVVLRNNAQMDEQKLIGHCAAQLPSYMVPEIIELCPNLPLMSSGKIDRRALLSGPISPSAREISHS